MFSKQTLYHIYKEGEKMDTTSNRLKQVMEELDISQSELVRRTGINKGALSSYISGRYIPKQRAIYALASALDVSEPWLMGYDVPKNRVEDSNASLSPNEKNLLDIYRVLDDKGQHTVDTVTQMEYERVKSKKD